MAVRYFEVVVFVFGRKKKKKGRGDQRDIPPGLSIITSYHLAQGNQGEYNFSAPQVTLVNLKPIHPSILNAIFFFFD